MLDHATQPIKVSAYAHMLDEDLVLLLQKGNHEAFAEIVGRYVRPTRLLAQRTLNSAADAEDVVQSVLIKLWQNPHSWQPNKASLGTWLYKVTLNACYDVSRSCVRRNTLEQDLDPPTDEADSYVLVNRAEQDGLRKQLLKRGMKSLSASQRDAINLAVFVGLPQKQVAEVLGVSVKAVESLLVRAKAKLKNFVENEKAGEIL